MFEKLVGAGYLARIDTNTFNGEAMAVLSIPIRQRRRQPDGTYTDGPTTWLSLVTDLPAVDKYAKGDLVAYAGTPRFRARLDKNGQPVMEITIFNPSLMRLSKSEQPADEPPF